jgi:hypothetical protein
LKLTVKRKTASGLAVETTTTSSGNNLAGSVKLTYKEKGLGEFEVSDNTKGALKGKAKFTNLQPGVVLTLEPSCTPTFAMKTTVDYSQDNFTVSGALTATESTTPATGDKAATSSFSTDVALSAVAGFEGVSLGGSVEAKSKDDYAQDFNMGLNFAEDDFNFSLVTSTDKKAGPIVTGRFFQKVSADLSSGFQFTNPSNEVTLGSEYRLDSKTVFANSVSTAGAIKLGVEHILSNPAAKVNLACSGTTSGLNLAVAKYGLSVTLGDF